MIIVVLDACSDRTESIARGFGVTTLHLAARKVGAARQLGAVHAIDRGARWLAFTDADSTVGDDWLSAQLAENSDAVCGTVVVDDWTGHPPQVRLQHLATYHDRAGHHHIHGANLGVSVEAFQRAGGFQPLSSHEDVVLVDALQSSGARIAWSARPRVATSARRDFRAPDGFGATLARVQALEPDAGV